MDDNPIAGAELPTGKGEGVWSRRSLAPQTNVRGAAPPLRSQKCSLS